MLLVAAVIALAGCHAASRPLAVTSPHHSRTPLPATQVAPSPAFSPSRSLIARAYWVHYPQGWRIRIMPSIYGRNHAPEAPRTALAEALRIARPTPLRLTQSVRASLLNQLRCHADFAPRKPLWDLEAWRPDVGYFKTVAAFCNPGGGG
jgi:hypothetical protein